MNAFRETANIIEIVRLSLRDPVHLQKCGAVPLLIRLFLSKDARFVHSLDGSETDA
jgi:hypothetical protein